MTARKSKPKKTILVIEQVPTDQLQENPENPRRNARAVRPVAESLARFGFRQPIVARKSDGQVIAGNTRLRAARLLKLPEVPVVWWTGTEKDATAYSIADNRVGEIATWEPTTLADILGELKEEDDNGWLKGMGYSPEDVEGILEKARNIRAGPLETPEVADPAPPHEVAEPVTRPGDIWLLGTQARVMCGDCTDKRDVAALFGGEEVSLMVTDPPYCSGGFQEAHKAAGTWGKVAADNLTTRGLQSLIGRALQAARPSSVYCFLDWKQWPPLFDVMEGAGIAVRAMIVWNKKTPGLGALWRTQHELIMFATRSTNRKRKGVPAIGNVIDMGRTGNRNHYTEKPVELLATLLLNDAKSIRGPVSVYDPFLGSGSTIMAAISENAGRPAFGMEVEAPFVDVTIRRFLETPATNGEKVILTGDGRTFEEVKAERRA